MSRQTETTASPILDLYIVRERNNPRKQTTMENGGDDRIQKAEEKDIFWENVLLNTTKKSDSQRFGA